MTTHADKPLSNPFGHAKKQTGGATHHQTALFNTPFSQGNTAATMEDVQINGGGAGWGADDYGVEHGDDFNFVADPVPNSNVSHHGH